VARLQDHLIGRNIDVLAGVVYLILRKKSTFGKSTLTTPAGKRTIVNISIIVIPATPPLKGGETYLVKYLIITTIFMISIFLKFTAMPLREKAERQSCR